MCCRRAFCHEFTKLCASRAAWKQLDDLPASEAKLQYIGLVKSACPQHEEAQAGKPKGGGPGGPVFSSLADGPEDTETGPVSSFRASTQFHPYFEMRR